MITFYKALDRYGDIPYGQRSIIAAILCAWIISTSGFIYGAKPISQLENAPIRISNIEASFREFLHHSDNQVIMVLDMLYTSPIENWWKATKIWSTEMILTLQRHGWKGEITVKAFKNWFAASMNKRLFMMKLDKIPIEEISSIMKKINPKGSLSNLPDEAYELSDTAHAKNMEIVKKWHDIDTQALNYEPAQIDDWLSKAPNEEWKDYDPHNRDKERSTYMKIAALKTAYAESDLNELARKFEEAPMDIYMDNLQVNRADDWNITDNAIDDMPDGELKRWIQESPARTMESKELEEALEAANLYAQVHDSNTIGWMHSHILEPFKTGEMRYSSDTSFGNTGQVCLALGQQFCMG